ncbi:unnamed protein product [Brassica oleracea]|uniref:Uncharacterized protein n=1 Tax=Brassica oleracea TaxID=3712 RepID=A0A3P6D669_BRAOL|nr:unnamed protein product [Brassica oleracea]
MKGYEKLLSLLAADCRCDEKRDTICYQIIEVEKKDNSYKEELTKVQSELWSLGEWTGGEKGIKGGGDVSGGGDETGGGGDGIGSEDASRRGDVGGGDAT